MSSAKGNIFIGMSFCKINKDHWDKIRNSLMVFFKSFVQDVLLGLKTLFVCPICNKSGIDHVDYDNERSLSCSRCSLKYHHKCSENETENEDFVCAFCSDIFSL